MRCQNSNTFAFKQLVEYYQQYLYVISFRITGNEEDAKDIVQECFIKVWKGIKRYKTEMLFTPWICKITVNLCYDKLKSAKYRNEKNKTDTELFAIAEDNNENEFSGKEMVAKIWKLAGQLPELQKMVFILRDIQCFSTEETAEYLKVTVTNVKSNLYYARRNIRQKLISATTII